MRTLKEEDIIRLMREEWARGVAALTEKVDMVLNAPVEKGGDELPVLSPQLKVRHKASQLRYTIASVGPRDVILLTPEGEKFIVDGADFEDAYQLD
jgi:hypothetical protein